MLKVKEFLLVIVVISLGALFGGSLYDTIVNAPNYRVGIPESLEHFRLFMSVANPGDFFRLVAPVTQISILVSLILNWKHRSNRKWWLLAALILVVAGDVITLTYHYPRNAILFKEPMNVSPEILTKAANEWIFGNYVRLALVTGAMVCGIKALLQNERAKDA
jgi:uncharacterized membrane protein